MKKIKIDRPVNLELLTEELFEAFPSWRYPDPLGLVPYLTDVAISADEIEIPDNTSPEAVQFILDTHNEKGKSKNQKSKEDKAERREELKDRTRRAESVADLRAVILDLLEELD